MIGGGINPTRLASDVALGSGRPDLRPPAPTSCSFSLSLSNPAPPTTATFPDNMPLSQEDKEKVLADLKTEDGFIGLESLSSDHQNDFDVVLAVLKVCGASRYLIEQFEYVSDELKANADLMLEAMRAFTGAEPFKYASDALKGDASFFRTIMGATGESHHLRDASDELKANAEIVRLAVGIQGGLLECVSDVLKDDADIVRAAVSNDGTALRFASDRLKNDYDTVMDAVTQDGFALGAASVELQSNEKIAIQAVWQNHKVMAGDNQVVPLALCNDVSFLKRAVRANFNVLGVLRDDDPLDDNGIDEQCATLWRTTFDEAMATRMFEKWVDPLDSDVDVDEDEDD